MGWEYRVIDLAYKKPQDIQNELCKLGFDRWELVAVVRQQFYMKRERRGA
jgi:hypothetical protein